MKKSRILQIGKAPEYLENKLKAEYEFYKLENSEIINNAINFDGSLNKEINTIPKILYQILRIFRFCLFFSGK
ncbi:MAG: hypothetical protein IPL53_09625 [Ignavibacteria bacterium]|nr:hypothetical protein [Ignavibacteria bacterium]